MTMRCQFKCLVILLRMVEEHYVKLLKVALTKELGPGAKLLYKIGNGKHLIKLIY